MKKPAHFLSRYDTVLFDMDGVLTSEQRYWDAAVLTVYEYLHRDFDPSWAMDNVAALRKNILHNDETLVYLKNAGVNSNWDTTYAVLSAALILGVTDDFAPVHDYLTSLGMDALELYDFLADKSPLGKRGGGAYDACVMVFQQWFLGDKLFAENFSTPQRLKGKPGLIWHETPVIGLERIAGVLKTLSEAGLSLGVGTGRVHMEITYPLDAWDIRRYFDDNRLITYSEVIAAERALGGQTLTKPHPYMFLKGMLGKDYDDRKITTGDYDKSLAAKTLVVGDAGADILAAHSGGMDFAAVLTGVSGQNARSYFEGAGAAYILDDVTGLIEGVE